MCAIRAILPLLAAGVLCFAAGAALAQQATISTPLHTAGDSFFERTGINWGFSTRGLNFSFGSPINPQFGNFDPNAGLNTNFTFGRPGNGGFFNFSAAQGYRQTFTTQAPSVTLMNGQPGFVADASLSPFVIGYVPVVGGFPAVSTLYPAMPMAAYPWAGPGAAAISGNPRVQAMLRAMAEQKGAGQNAAAASELPGAPAAGVAARPPTPAKPAERKLRDRPDQVQAAAMRSQNATADKLSAVQASSAGRAVPSVAEARRLHQLEQSSVAEQAVVLFERGRAAEEDGKPGVARIYYQMVADRASGELKQQVLARLAALRETNSP